MMKTCLMLSFVQLVIAIFGASALAAPNFSKNDYSYGSLACQAYPQAKAIKTKPVNEYTNILKTEYIRKIQIQLKNQLNIALGLGEKLSDFNSSFNLVSRRCDVARHLKDKVFAALDLATKAHRTSSKKDSKGSKLLRRKFMHKLMVASLEWERLLTLKSQLQRLMDKKAGRLSEKDSAYYSSVLKKVFDRMIVIDQNYSHLRFVDSQGVSLRPINRLLQDRITQHRTDLLKRAAYTTSSRVDEILFDGADVPKVTIKPIKGYHSLKLAKFYGSMINRIVVPNSKQQFRDSFIERKLREAAIKSTVHTIRTLAHLCEATPCETFNLAPDMASNGIPVGLPDSDRADIGETLCSCRMNEVKNRVSPWTLLGTGLSTLVFGGACAFTPVVPALVVACQPALVSASASLVFALKDSEDKDFNEEKAYKKARAQAAGLADLAVSSKTLSDLKAAQNAAFWATTRVYLDTFGVFTIGPMSFAYTFPKAFKTLVAPVQRNILMNTAISPKQRQINKALFDNNDFKGYRDGVLARNDNVQAARKTGRVPDTLIGHSKSQEATRDYLMVRWNRNKNVPAEFQYRAGDDDVFGIVNYYTDRSLRQSGEKYDEAVKAGNRIIDDLIKGPKSLLAKSDQGFTYRLQQPIVRLKLHGSHELTSSDWKTLSQIKEFIQKMPKPKQTSESKDLLKLIKKAENNPHSTTKLELEDFHGGRVVRLSLPDIKDGQFRVIRRPYANRRQIEDREMVIERGIRHIFTHSYLEELLGNSEILKLLLRQERSRREVEIIQFSIQQIPVIHRPAELTKLLNRANWALSRTGLLPRSNAHVRMQAKEIVGELKVMIRRKKTRRNLREQSKFPLGQAGKELIDGQSTALGQFLRTFAVLGSGSIGIHIYYSPSFSWLLNFGDMVTRGWHSFVRTRSGFTTDEFNCVTQNPRAFSKETGCYSVLSTKYLMGHILKSYALGENEEIPMELKEEYQADREWYRRHMLKLAKRYAAGEIYQGIINDYKQGYQDLADETIIELVEQTYPRVYNARALVTNYLVAIIDDNEELIPLAEKPLRENFGDYFMQEIQHYTKNREKFASFVRDNGRLPVRDLREMLNAVFPMGKDRLSDQ